MKPWVALYEDLMGRPPTPVQIARVERIRSILRLRDDDAFWHILLVHDFYENSMATALKRFDAIRSEIVAVRNHSVLTWSVIRAFFCQTPVLFLAGILVFLPIVANIICTFSVEAWRHADDEQARASDRSERQAASENEITRVHAAVRQELSEIQGGIPQNAVDQRSSALFGAIGQLTSEEITKLAANPENLVRILHILVMLPPEMQSALLVANDPAASDIAKRNSTLQFFESQIVNNTDISRLIAAYAAGNRKLMDVLGGLSRACSLVHPDACKQHER